jgi:NIMA (never in mitosis gene a)-related kinase
MRPSCDKILEMPIVRKKTEKLFQNDIFDDQNEQVNLLSTIRVPKNLLYLTDRLPKPQYDSDERKRREQEELLR